MYWINFGTPTVILLHITWFKTGLRSIWPDFKISSHVFQPRVLLCRLSACGQFRIDWLWPGNKMRLSLIWRALFPKDFTCVRLNYCFNTPLEARPHRWFTQFLHPILVWLYSVLQLATQQKSDRSLLFESSHVYLPRFSPPSFVAPYFLDIARTTQNFPCCRSTDCPREQGFGGHWIDVCHSWCEYPRWEYLVDWILRTLVSSLYYICADLCQTSIPYTRTECRQKTNRTDHQSRQDQWWQGTGILIAI